jgi:hypothetical protein
MSESSPTGFCYACPEWHLSEDSMTIYYFKAKVSINDTPPSPWIIDGREVLVSFTDETWWAFSEELLNDDEDIQQAYKSWIKQLGEYCTLEEELAPKKVRALAVTSEDKVRNVSNSLTKMVLILVTIYSMYSAVMSLQAMNQSNAINAFAGIFGVLIDLGRDAALGVVFWGACSFFCIFLLLAKKR